MEIFLANLGRLLYFLIAHVTDRRTDQVSYGVVAHWLRNFFHKNAEKKLNLMSSTVI